MHKAAIALAAGADFSLLGPRRTMLRSSLPVIAICAVRTGVGKSQVARWLAERLKQRGLKVAVLRHPMPYGDLERQAVQRFTSLADLDAAACTIEEREEYEPHIRAGGVVLTGVDYACILALAEQDANVIVWDGGNNDFPFVEPDLQIVLVDPLRPGHEATHHPGEAVLCMGDIVVVAKANAASEADISRVTETARSLAPNAAIVRAGSVVTLEDRAAVAGKRVLVVDDGPTLTHGGMRYSAKQRADLQATINGSSAEVVVAGTPSDLSHILALDKPVVRARYELAEMGEPSLSRQIDDFLHRRWLLERTPAE